ncbi:MAG: alanine/glycine:cation symporter family protein [Halieaceae bacterium]|jgi:AGCS family alanine or glycine:cation symporter|nr:alanine/glycine:cation symporter family protein [Halieaceae bacterium]
MNILAPVTDFLWSYVLVTLLVGVGVAASVMSRFAQFRFFLAMFASLRRGLHHQAGHLSAFQALIVSVAGRVGGGNIAGVAVAITLGGPGAVFWMWLIGLMGMATSLFECSLAQLFKRAQPDGTYRGGPAAYMRYGLQQPLMAGLFSLLLLLTFGFSFNAVQSYIVATSLQASFALPTWVTGSVLALLVGVTIFGGIRRIARVAEVVVPVMALGYILVALVVVLMHLNDVPAALATILRAAFGFEQAVSGGLAAVIMQGVKRGLFSNEAGLGSAPNVAAVAYVPHPVHQGMVQSLSVFIDTLVLCTCTAVIIILSDAHQPGTAGVNGVALTQAALAGHVGSWGEGFISVALCLFAFSSIMYNYYLGENSLYDLSPDNNRLVTGFRVCVPALVLWGSLQDLSTIFAFADLTMGLLGIVNLVALIWLLPLGLRLLRDFDQQRRKQAVPRLDTRTWSDLDIDAAAWRD